MADYNIRVTVDPSGAKAGARQVEGALNSIGGSANRLRGQLAAAFGFTTLAAGLADTIKTLAGFDQAMASVKAVSGATEAELASLTATARELGAETRFGATQAAEGLLLLAQAGFTAQQQIDTLDDTLTLAQAGGLALGRAAEITGSVLAGFRLNTDQAGRVVDVLAKGANIAATDVTELGDAMSYVAPLAASLNVGLEEATGAITALSDAGIRGTRAGIGLREILSGLESPTDAAKEILRKYGLEAKDVKVSTVGLATALKRLAESGVEGGTSLELLGERGGPAFEVLRNATDKVLKNTLALKDAGGSAAAVAKTMDENLNGALLKVGSAFQELKLSVGEFGATDALEQFFLGLAQALLFLSRNLDPVVKGIKLLGVTMLAVFAPQLLASFATGIGAVTASVKGLTLAIATNPLGALLVAITAVIGYVVIFGDDVQLASDKVTTLGDVGRAAFEYISQGVQLLLASLGLTDASFDDLQRQFADGREGLKQLRNDSLSFGQVFANVIAATVNAFAQFGAGIGAVASFIVNSFKIIFAEFTNIKGIATGLADAFGKLAKGDFVGAFLALGLPVVKFAGDLSQTVDDLKADFAEIATLDPGQAILDRADKLGRLRDEMDRANKPGEQPAGGPGGVPPGAGPAPVEKAASPLRDIQQYLDALQNENTLLFKTNEERSVQAELLRIEDELKRKLTTTELGVLETAIRQQQALAAQSALLEEIRGPRDSLIAQQNTLNELFSSGLITLDEYSKKMGELNQATAELSNTYSGGFSAGIQQAANRTQDLGRAVQQEVVASFEKAEDAIAKWATTGEFNIRELTSSILESFAKIALQQATSNLIGGIAGAVGGAAGGGGFGGLFAQALGGLKGYATGGTFGVGGNGGTDSQLVAFKATPGEEVSVKTPGQQQTSSAPVVVPAPAVNVINVTNPDEVPLGITSAKGAEAVMNVISQNAGSIKQLVAQ